jgi:hypothetical protein
MVEIQAERESLAEELDLMHLVLQPPEPLTPAVEAVVAVVKMVVEF